MCRFLFLHTDYKLNFSPDQFISCLNKFKVDARGTEKTGDGKVAATIVGPGGKKVSSQVKNNNDGTYEVSYILPEAGDYKFDVKYDDAAVPGTPAAVKATHGFDAKRVKVYGPGIEKGFVNQPNVFTIETTGAGNGGVGLAFNGPSEPKVKCTDNRNGTCTVEYTPELGGSYDIGVKFGDQPVPGNSAKKTKVVFKAIRNCLCLPSKQEVRSRLLCKQKLMLLKWFAQEQV